MLLSGHDDLIRSLINRYAREYNIRVYSFANVGNHLHFLIKTESKVFHVAHAEFKAFIRRLTGEIAFRITGAKKSNKLGRRFWDSIPFSRIVHWGRSFEVVRDYIVKNLFEGAGLWSRKLHPELQMIKLSMTEAGMPPPGAKSASVR